MLDLASLPRNELQRRAKEAGIKANQSNEALVRQLQTKHRGFGAELSASQANQPASARKHLCKVSENRAYVEPSPLKFPTPQSMRKQLSPVGPRFQAFSPIMPSRLSTSSVMADSTVCMSAQKPLVEMNTIELTVARLRSLGFEEEEAKWAAEAARARLEGQDAESDYDVSLDLSLLRICDEPEKEVEEKQGQTLLARMLRNTHRKHKIFLPFLLLESHGLWIFHVYAHTLLS
jgi:hypothetical protein